MGTEKKPYGYWNDFDKCKEEALKYNSRSEFKKKYHQWEYVTKCFYSF